MRIRTGFVSNSSSASFTIFPKSVLSDKQVARIHGYEDYANILMRKTGDYAPSDEMKEAFEFIDDLWCVKEFPDRIEGFTLMTNFDMEYYLLKVVKVPEENLKMEYDAGAPRWWKEDNHED